MNILLLAVLFTATQAATPFKWELDLEKCINFVTDGYYCFMPVNGKFKSTQSDLNYDTWLEYYQKQNPIFAIKAQSSNRWIVVMQIGSRKNKFDVNYGMKLHRVLGNKTEDFLGCRLESGKVVTTSSKDIETHLIDSYSDDENLFCDFYLTAKTGTKKNLTDIVARTDSFAMSVRIDEKIQKYADDMDPSRSWIPSYDRNFVATVVHADDRTHKCDLSQAKFDPTEALTKKWGKVRTWEYIGDEILCTDSRYTLHVTDSKNRRIDNAEIICEKGKYKIRHKIVVNRKEYTLEPSETFNAVCYIEYEHLCPLYIPCDKDDKEYCPKVIFHLKSDSERYRPPTYDLYCFNGRHLVAGVEENPFDYKDVNCRNHKLVVSVNHAWDKYQSPTTEATVAYCEERDTLKKRPKKPKKKPTGKKEGGTIPGTSGKSSADDEKNRENSSFLPAFSLALMLALPIVAY